MMLCRLLALACLLATAPPSAAADRPLAAATLFPIYDMARALSQGTGIDAVLAVPPGAEPHTWDPRPSDAARLSRASLLLHLGDRLQPWLPRLAAALPPRVKAVDLSLDPPGRPLTRRGDDPHLWLDLGNARTLAHATALALEKLSPGDAGRIRENLAAYDSALAALDARFTAGLAGARGKELFVAGHAAFGHLASRYGLVQVPLMGLSPDAEPGPRTVAEVARRMRRAGARAVFAEELLPPRLAATIAEETGARVLLLNPGHNLTSEEWKAGLTFPALMERNLERLREGLAP